MGGGKYWQNNGTLGIKCHDLPVQIIVRVLLVGSGSAETHILAAHLLLSPVDSTAVLSPLARAVRSGSIVGPRSYTIKRSGA